MSEIHNVLLLAIRRDRTTLKKVGKIVEAFARLPLHVDTSAQGLGSTRVVEMAVTSRLSAYDATYVVLAQSLGAQLMTRDSRMRAVA